MARILMRILMIDNYDSFTYNLVQYLGELGAELEVRRNDAIDVAGVRAMAPQAIVISPGPCTPKEAGVSVPLLREMAGELPILGVCLGHQCIGEAFGGKVVRAGRLMHGKTSPIVHDGRNIFAGLPNPFDAMRYHSLLVDADSVPSSLEVSARTAEGEVMGLTASHAPGRGDPVPSRIDRHARGQTAAREFSKAGCRMSELRDAFDAVLAGRSLDAASAERVMGEIFDGEPAEALIAGFLVALKLKRESAAELTGGARAMRARARALDLDGGNVLDTAGTGGDGAGTFNISTGAALVAAAAGVPVAKHGNRAISGRVGAADVLERFRVKIDLDPEGVQRCLRAAGCCFIFAPAYHPVLARLAGLQARARHTQRLQPDRAAEQSGASAPPVARRRRAAAGAPDGRGAGRTWGRPCDGGARRRRTRRAVARRADTSRRDSRRRDKRVRGASARTRIRARRRRRR